MSDPTDRYQAFKTFVHYHAFFSAIFLVSAIPLDNLVFSSAYGQFYELFWLEYALVDFDKYSGNNVRKFLNSAEFEPTHEHHLFVALAICRTDLKVNVFEHFACDFHCLPVRMTSAQGFRHSRLSLSAYMQRDSPMTEPALIPIFITLASNILINVLTTWSIDNSP